MLEIIGSAIVGVLLIVVIIMVRMFMVQLEKARIERREQVKAIAHRDDPEELNGWELHRYGKEVAYRGGKKDGQRITGIALCIRRGNERYDIRPTDRYYALDPSADDFETQMTAYIKKAERLAKSLP